jgi:ketosteroid isomerase-like protein
MSEPASPERLDQIRRGYAALERGDVEAVVAEMSEEVEWRNPEGAIEGGTRMGKTAFKGALEALLDTFVDYDVQIVDSVQVGDDTAVLIRARAQGRTSGAPLDQLFGHVFRFEDGVQVALEWYNDPTEALRAVRAPTWAGGAVADGS